MKVPFLYNKVTEAAWPRAEGHIEATYFTLSACSISNSTGETLSRQPNYFVFGMELWGLLPTTAGTVRMKEGKVECNLNIRFIFFLTNCDFKNNMVLTIISLLEWLVLGLPPLCAQDTRPCCPLLSATIVHLCDISIQKSYGVLILLDFSGCDITQPFFSLSYLHSSCQLAEQRLQHFFSSFFVQVAA